MATPNETTQAQAAPPVVPAAQKPPAPPSAVGRPIHMRVNERQVERDKQTRANAAAREKWNEENAAALKRLASATGNAFARQGLNATDKVKAIGLLRDDTPWEKVKKLMPEVANEVLEKWKDELIRLSKLPPGGERTKLGPNVPVQGPVHFTPDRIHERQAAKAKAEEEAELAAAVEADRKAKEDADKKAAGEGGEGTE